MIKVTLEFPSIEAAIATLGKIMVAAPKAGVVKDKVVAPAPAPVEGDKPQPPGVVPAQAAATTRKPRADAGKKRGSYKNVEAPEPQVPAGSATGGDPAAASAPVASTPQTAAPAGVQSKSTGSDAPAPVAAVPSEADAQTALEKVFTNKSLAAAQDVLARFGVKRLRDLLPEQRADFIQLAEESAK